MIGRLICIALILFIFTEITLASYIFDGTHGPSETVSVNRRFVGSEDSVLNSFVDISAYQCYTECKTRPGCKAVEYKYRTKYCKLFSAVREYVTASGSLIITGFLGNHGSCGNQTCELREVCVIDKDTCEIAECGHPEDLDFDVHTTGNVYSKGSKAVYSCFGVPGPRTLICTDSGTWTMTRQLFYTGITCKDLRLENEHAETGVYINRFGMSIYCDFDIDGGDWMVIQRRFDGTLNFDRTWQEYRGGFGKVCSEFWLGLENIYKLLHEKGGPFDLRFDMESTYEEKHFAYYRDFEIGSEGDNYRIIIQFYNGTVTDKFEYSNGQMFTTVDRDNDESLPGNCAVRFRGGWWYKDCYGVNFNGVYIEGTQWGNMHLHKVSMKIRELF